ncbi:hypothetical protein H8E88_21970 [candidate division KSB1 bacterium]|nr:hypothetical protein [candidate division KSB1 bacterium]MBL7093595.1 hypothetical protein [candidate division KSB1 bacterium]
MNTHLKLESLIELAVVLGRQNEFKEILRIVSTKASALVDSDVASIMMINPNTQNTIKTIYKDGHETNSKQYKIIQMNVVGLMLTNKQPFLMKTLIIILKRKENYEKDLNLISSDGFIYFQLG